MLVPLFQYVYGGRCCAVRGTLFHNPQSLSVLPKRYTLSGDLGERGLYRSAKKTGKFCTKSSYKRSLRYQFISCRVPPSKSDISRGVPCCVSSRPFTGGRRRSNLVVKHSHSSVSPFNDPGSPLRAPARNTATRTVACFREH